MRLIHRSAWSIAWRFVALALCILAASCASRRDDGRYVAFVQDIMAESARLQTTPTRAERALTAVEAWRGGTDGTASSAESAIESGGGP